MNMLTTGAKLPDNIVSFVVLQIIVEPKFYQSSHQLQFLILYRGVHSAVFESSS